MERLKQMSLKKSFFCITLVFLLVALILSIVFVLLIRYVLSGYDAQSELLLNSSPTTLPSYIIHEQELPLWYQPLNALQLILPVVLVIAGLLLADIFFYRLKLKKPLAILKSGVERIQRQDLDFSIEKRTDDELGTLCAAFETMRIELLQNNRELWRQMEERKRLNAAFSHDLRNPVTVLKGSATILQKGLERGILTTENAGDTVSLISQYVSRIETYIEAMTSAQKLEELKCKPQATDWSVMVNELENSLSILCANMGKEIEFSCTGDYKQILVDRYIVQNTAENLISNALRYTRDKVTINLSCEKDKLILIVSDNGPGFSSTILNKGAAPFLRDDNNEAQKTHFGMGLYMCRLLCEKHGGSMILENSPHGARVIATFYFLKP